MKRLQAPAVVKKWKKFLVCGCSHGDLASKSALDAVIKFRRDYRPDKCIHVGDFIDTAAWRGGAKGGPDEVEKVGDDIVSGLTFLERLKPNLVFNGNHEIRIWHHAQKPNAIISHAAAVTINNLRNFIVGDLKAEYVEDYVLEKSWRWIGNYLVGHGFFYNLHAVKKHADKLGNTIFAHLHRQEVARGDRVDRPTGVCIGFLGDREKFTYADQWESRFRWDMGWCWGEYSDDDCLWNLYRHIEKQPSQDRFKSV